MRNRRRPAELVCSIGLAIAGLGLMAVAAPPVSHDFNADGSNDYPVSVTGHDPIAPVNGAARMWSGASKSIIDTIIGDETNTLFGWSIGSAGDLDADGFDDLIVGEPLWGPNGTLQGRVRVFSGDDSSVLLTATGPYLETGLGRYVAGIGDWNGDGTPDIVSSGWDIADLDNDGIGDDAIGSVYVLSGVDGSVLAEIFEPTATALFGYSVFGLGDITGDGLADIAVVDRGAEGAPGSGAIGRLYIFTGRTQTAQLSTTDAHRTILNNDPTLRGFAAQVDTMHPDLWLDEATLQIISLTAGGTGGPNQAETAIAIRKADGQVIGTKGVRPTLVLAGDVNLDGKVNAQDLQASIAQLGTNPQALGVMPLADLNQDNIVDTHDVALLLQDYGDETDIYEGLWDGSRLLAVVGGSAGFGSVNVAPIGGNWGVAPGRRPGDDCVPADVDMPPDIGQSLLPVLLRGDAARNCGGFSCGTPETKPECWYCFEPNKVSGGRLVGAQAPAPIGQAIQIEVVGATPIPGRLKCGQNDGAGPCPMEPEYRRSPAGTVLYGWTVSYPDSNGNWPPEAEPVAFTENNIYTTTLTQACQMRRVTAWVQNSYCPDNPRKVGSRVLTSDGGPEPIWQVSDVDPESQMFRPRFDLGVGESVQILNPTSGPSGVANIQHSDNLQIVPGQDFFTYRAIHPGAAWISLQIGGVCLWSTNFEIHEPKLTFVRCPNFEWWETRRNLFGSINQIRFGFKVRIRLEPATVSFRHVEIREGPCPPAAISGVFVGMWADGGFHFPTQSTDQTVWGPALQVDPRQPGGEIDGLASNWIINAYDTLELTTTPVLNNNSQGLLIWNIPYEYRLVGEDDTSWRPLTQDVKQITQLNSGYAVSITKAEGEAGGVVGTFDADGPNQDDNPYDGNSPCDIGPSDL